MREMRTWNRNAKVFGTAVLLSLGVAMTSQAATDGWYQENGNWTYYDRGARVRDQWKKSDRGFWFYLDSNGYMVKNTMVDSKYVNEDGAMIVNAWRKIYAEGEDSWFYFTSTGRMAEDGWKSINGKKYHFDSDGTMDSGWFDDNQYYLGTEDDGAMRIGWAHVQGPEDSDVGDDEYDFYFGSNGIVTKDKIGKKIGSFAYAFDKDGRMLYGWVDAANKVSDSADEASGDMKDYQYFKSEQLKSGIDGSRMNGWKRMDPPESVRSSADETPYYYFKDGVPYHAEGEDNYLIKSIGGKKYCFNRDGEMQYGFKYMAADGKKEADESDAGSELYYFGERHDGAMKTGTATLYNEEDGEKRSYYFASSGKGHTGMKNSCIYVKGKRLDADKDLKYQVVTDGTNVRLVNTSGKIQKPSSGSKVYEDGDGRTFTVSSTGEVTKMPDGYVIKDR